MKQMFILVCCALWPATLLGQLAPPAPPANLRLQPGNVTGLQCTAVATSAARADVQAALDASSVGDVICVPAGTQTWTTSVTAPRRLTIQGAGQGLTVITLNDGVSLALGTTNSSLTGFTITSPTTTGASYVSAAGTSGEGRIHHNTFIDTTPGGSIVAGISHSGGNGTHPVYLDDHNTFVSTRIRLFATNQPSTNSAGEQYWEVGNLLPLDTLDECIYIEDNFFTNSTNNSTETDQGGCMVVRFNTFGSTTADGTEASVHGTAAGGNGAGIHPPGRILEFYKNICLNELPGIVESCTWFRAGTGWIWGNSFRSGIYSQGIHFDIQGRTPTSGCQNDDPPEDSACCGTSVTADGNLGSGTTYPAAGWPCFSQPGFGKYNGEWTPSTYPGMVAMPIGIWWNRECTSPTMTSPCSLSDTQVSPTFRDSAQNWIANGHEYQNETSSFDGTIGTGVGTIANRPSTCEGDAGVSFGATYAAGVYYWATDEGEWNSRNGATADGRLYKCTADNTWTLWYTPYTYPHPLQGS